MKKFCLRLLFLCVASLCGESVIAQQAITTDEIVQSLKPKVRTRGMAAPSLKGEDAAFVERIKHTTRGLTVEERTHLSDIVSTAALPSINLEVTFALNSAKLEPSAIETWPTARSSLTKKKPRGLRRWSPRPYGGMATSSLCFVRPSYSPYCVTLTTPKIVDQIFGRLSRSP
jgi:hypothetical protein